MKKLTRGQRIWLILTGVAVPLVMGPTLAWMIAKEQQNSGIEVVRGRVIQLGQCAYKSCAAVVQVNEHVLWMSSDRPLSLGQPVEVEVIPMGSAGDVRYQLR